MCHGYGKITTELVRIRSTVTHRFSNKGLYHRHLQALTDMLTARANTPTIPPWAEELTSPPGAQPVRAKIESAGQSAKNPVGDRP